MKKIFFLILFVFSFINSNAQIDRRIGAGQYSNGDQNKKVDIVESSVELLKKELNLDGFQEAIVRNLIKDNQSKSKEIIETSIYSDIEKKNLLTEIGEKFNTEIKKILSPEQLEKYEKFIAKKKK
ncbi:MAG: hypothetical protein L6Q46_04130 [Flavobacterium sp.]|uniref:hypothetical protein n=1 Tax=Flavobacterium sp. TaxID=239 RepID=UPI0025B7B595|nr:hypothetical protein [Flavobacterium sp.]MCK6607478.1 hypothetical protein [Flavobacterium sp.]